MAALLLTACTAPSPMAGPETIAAGPTTITIRAGGWTDPIEHTQKHCAEHGRNAVLVGQSRIDDYEVEDLFVYDCVKPE